jgi:hypothetical protein
MRGYDSLAHALHRQPPERVEVTRIERGGAVAAFLVESPEPIDWKRTSVPSAYMRAICFRNDVSESDRDPLSLDMNHPFG